MPAEKPTPAPPTPPQLGMRRDSLAGLPPVALPGGYSIRQSTDHDDAAWERILTESFATPFPPGSFARIMRADPAYRPDRVLFLCAGDEPVGTASAWHRPAYGERTGYLHYVAVLPAHAGRGLGLQVSLACLHLMAGDRRTAAVLQTDDFRLPAIRTYLKLGFGPVLVEEAQRERWREVYARLGMVPPARWPLMYLNDA